MSKRFLLCIFAALLVVSCASPPEQHIQLGETVIQPCNAQQYQQSQAECLAQSSAYPSSQPDMEMYLILRSIFDVAVQVILNLPDRYPNAYSGIGIHKQR